MTSSAIHILHLEDNPNDAQLVKTTLNSDDGKHVTIDVVNSKQQFTNKLNNHTYDIILINYNMSGWNGLDAIKYAKKESGTIPIIVVSTAIGDERAIKAIQHGAMDYVLKSNLSRLPIAVARTIKTKKLIEAQRKQLSVQEELVSSAEAGLFKVDSSGLYIHVNKSLTTMLGYPEKDFLMDKWMHFIHPTDKNLILSQWKSQIKTAQKFQFETRVVTNKRKTLWVQCICTPQFDEQHHLTGYIGTVMNITELKKAQQKLEKIAHIDALTHLPNRRLFQETLNATIENIKRDMPIFAVLYIDLDHFKNINDTFGHAMGDQLLKEAGSRLKSLVRKGDFVARIGGDEFVIILRRCKTKEAVHHLAERILNAFQEAFHFNHHECTCTASVGITMLQVEQNYESETIIQYADQALYRAKQNGRNRIEYFTKYLCQEVTQSTNLTRDLEQAIKKNELYLVYQPLIHLTNQNVAGCEVLVRWKHSEQGLISPDIFIPLAEKTGLINQITDWIIDGAFSQISQWTKKFPELSSSHFTFAINISATHFMHEHTFEYLNAKILQYNINPNNITLEITETAMMQDIVRMKQILHNLSCLNLCIAIDDFGTGYSSLNYLKELPLKIIKIDKSFIHDIHHQSTKVIIKGVILLAKIMKLKVIAEGIETKKQYELLKKLHCQYGQGYYFSPPIEPKHMETLLNEKWR